MKILHVVNRYKPSVGGAQTHVQLIAEEQVRRNHNVHVFTTKSISSEDYPNIRNRRSQPIPDLPDTEYMNGVKVRRFDVTRNFYGFVYSPELINSLSSISGFDIIHVHGYYILTSVLAAHYATKYDLPVVLTAHSVISPPTQVPFYEKLLMKCYGVSLGRYLLEKCDHYIAMTNNQLINFNNRGIQKEDITIVPNCVDFNRFESNNGTDALLFDQYGISEEDDIILYVGRIDKYKGLQDVIDILPNLIQSNSNLHLLIIGEDNGYQKKLQEKIAKRGLNEYVTFTGVIKTGLGKYYSAAEVFVFPSYMEGFGIVLLEAMYHRCICVARSLPATEDIIDDNINGYLFTNKKELGIYLSDCLNNGEERIKNHAYETSQQYTVGSIVDEIDRIYRSII